MEEALWIAKLHYEEIGYHYHQIVESLNDSLHLGCHNIYSLQLFFAIALTLSHKVLVILWYHDLYFLQSSLILLDQNFLLV